MPQVGPITMWVNSTTRMPSSGRPVCGAALMSATLGHHRRVRRFAPRSLVAQADSGMSGLRGLALLLLLQVAGERSRKRSPPIRPVVGMVLLLDAALAPLREPIQAVAEFLLAHLSLLFVRSASASSPTRPDLAVRLRLDAVIVGATCDRHRPSTTLVACSSRCCRLPLDDARRRAGAHRAVGDQQAHRPARGATSASSCWCAAGAACRRRRPELALLEHRAQPSSSRWTASSPMHAPSFARRRRRATCA